MKTGEQILAKMGESVTRLNEASAGNFDDPETQSKVLVNLALVSAYAWVLDVEDEMRKQMLEAGSLPEQRAAMREVMRRLGL
jgi:hypothetical protein